VKTTDRPAASSGTVFS